MARKGTRYVPVENAPTGRLSARTRELLALAFCGFCLYVMLCLATYRMAGIDGVIPRGGLRNLGGSFGISIIFTMLARNTQTSHADIAASITAYNLPGIDPGASAERFGEYGLGSLQMIDAEINRQALMIAYIDNFHVMALLLLLIALAALLLRPPIIPGTQEPH